MSISTQPAARHTSLQRVLSARLHVPSTMDMTASSTDPADKMQRPRVTTMDEASWPQPLSNCAAQTYSNDSSLSCLPQAQLPAQGLLPAIASELASQLQAKKRASFSCQPTCSSGTGQAHCTAADVPEATTSDPLKHNSKRVRLSPVTNIDVRLAQQAACLEEELAAMKAGAAVISDKAAWVAAARHTAHQLQEAARAKVLKAFRAALRYMDEETLQSQLAMHLQLPASPKEQEAEAQCTGPSLQAPQALSCPRKPRTRRGPRPASAASHGLAREPSLSRPVSAPAERSGWDWGQDLPSATSALLQAVEVAAAAEPGPSDASLLSWNCHHRDARLPSLNTDALKAPPTVATAALLPLASDAHSHLPKRMAVDPDSRPGANVATHNSTAEDCQLPLRVPRPSQQGGMMASSLPEQVGGGGQLASRPGADPAIPPAPSQGPALASSLNQSADLVNLLSAEQAWLWNQQAMVGPKVAAGSSSLQAGHAQRPDSMLPVLQSPFAAMADLPMHVPPTQTAASQMAPSASVLQQHLDSQLPDPLAGAQAAPQAGSQAHACHAQQTWLGQAELAEQQDYSSAQKRQREKPPSGLGKKVHLPVRLPLSPSSVRSNGEASVLQPLAKAQARALHPGGGLHSSSGNMQSLHHMHDCKLGLKGIHPVSQSELLPGRNVVVSNAAAADLQLAQLLILPSQWCWVARIDKVLASHMRVSWYGKHNGRWTLARYVAGPDEGQVVSGDVAISDQQIMAVFDRFTGNKEVPAETIVSAAAHIASIMTASAALAGDQENRSSLCTN